MDKIFQQLLTFRYFLREGNGIEFQYSFAWKIPWMEEPGRLQWMGSLSRTRLSDFTFPFHFHALEKGMATHSSVLAWKIPGTGEPGGLLSMGSHRVRHHWNNFIAAAADILYFLNWDTVNYIFPVSLELRYLLWGWNFNIQSYILEEYAMWNN